MQQTRLPNCVCGLPCTGNVLFGEKCGCFFHWRCIENVDMGCPNHGPAFPLAYTKKTCFCVGCHAAGDLTKHKGRVKLCRSCGDTILERIVSLVVDEYGYKYEHLFQKLFCAEMGLWPDIIKVSARDGLFEYAEDGTLVTNAGTLIYPLLNDAWNAVIELVKSSARLVMVTDFRGIWYSPQLVLYGLSSMPIDTHSFSSIAKQVDIPDRSQELGKL